MSLMLPAPEALQLDPGEAVQVQLAPVSGAGSASLTVAAMAKFGPALDTTIVYVTGWPGSAVVCPSVLVTDRSAVAATTRAHSSRPVTPSSAEK